MKIFILEDAPERIKIFREVLKGNEIVQVDNAKDAIEILSKDLNFSYFYLDHDLGGEIFVSVDNYNTGTTVAKYLSGKNIEGTIIIHSMNYYGAVAMKGYLPQARIIPFSSEIFRGVGV